MRVLVRRKIGECAVRLCPGNHAVTAFFVSCSERRRGGAPEQLWWPLRLLLREGAGTRPYRLAVLTHAAGATISVGGDLTDHEGVARLDELATSLLRRGEELRIDLSGVERADTKLIAALVAARRAADESGATIGLVQPPLVRRWARLCGLHRVCDEMAGDTGTVHVLATGRAWPGRHAVA